MITEASEAKTQSLPIRVRHTLGSDGATWTARTVYCPERRRSMTLAECQSCDKCEGVTLGVAGDGGMVICKRPDSEQLADGATHIDRRFFPTAADRTPIAAAMSSEVTCVTPELDLQTVSELFLSRGYGSAPVVDDEGFPIGVIAQSDLLRRPAEGGGIVADVMMPIAFTLRESDPLSRAAALMSIERVHHLPIVSEDGRVVGILSSLDLATWLARESGYSG